MLARRKYTIKVCYCHVHERKAAFYAIETLGGAAEERGQVKSIHSTLAAICAKLSGGSLQTHTRGACHYDKQMAHSSDVIHTEMPARFFSI